MASHATTRLFVYGTLRRGAPMHGLLEEAARFLSKACVRGTLWDMGAYPAFHDSEGESEVCGDLFEIEADIDKTFDVLDRYEGDGFERVIRLVRSTSGEVGEAFVFRFRGDVAKGTRIESGDYLAHLASQPLMTRAGREFPRE